MPHDAIDVSEQLGPLAERLPEHLERFRANAEAFAQTLPTLLATHNRQWVAVCDGEVAAHSQTLERILEILDEKGLPRASCFVDFVSDEQRVLIL